jgi:hypothetical protein
MRQLGLYLQVMATTPARTFRDNFGAAWERHQQRTGETLAAFATRLWPNDPSRYKWLRKLKSEGSPVRNEGHKNHDDLKRLHEALGLSWPALWTPIGDTSITARLDRLLSRSGALRGEIEEAVGQVLDRYEPRVEHLDAADEAVHRLQREHPYSYYWLLNTLTGNRDKIVSTVADRIALGGVDLAYSNLVSWCHGKQPQVNEQEPKARSPEEQVLLVVRSHPLWSKYIEEHGDEEDVLVAYRTARDGSALSRAKMAFGDGALAWAEIWCRTVLDPLAEP